MCTGGSLGSVTSNETHHFTKGDLRLRSIKEFSWEFSKLFEAENIFVKLSREGEADHILKGAKF